VIYTAACAQLAPKIVQIKQNVDEAAEAILHLGHAGADLVVLPELASSGYVFESKDEARALAQPADGPALGAWVRAAQDAATVVVAGFAELGDDGNLYNSAAVLDGDGVIAVYRKTHLWDREKLVFTPGSVAPPVVDTRVGRIGVVICYDLEFPENARSLALRGAELIAVPTNWPLFPRPIGERPPEVLNVMAIARFNRVFLVAADRVGTERGQEWTGGSAIVDCDGWPLAEAQHDNTQTLLAEIDPARARDKQWTEYADLFSDRRPELYGALVDKPSGVTAPRHPPMSSTK
jgi:predicted amidohydrolase